MYTSLVKSLSPLLAGTFLLTAPQYIVPQLFCFFLASNNIPHIFVDTRVVNRVAQIGTLRPIANNLNKRCHYNL